jgi:hypothetical protein
MTTPSPRPGPQDMEDSQQFGGPPSSMLGTQESAGPSPEEMHQQVLMNATAQVRAVEQAVMDIASQFPASAADARMVVQGIRSMLRRIVSSPGGQEPVAPRTMG